MRPIACMALMPLLTIACATSPEERVRDERLWQVAQACSRGRDIRVLSINPDGVLHYEIREGMADERGFFECYRRGARESGRLASPAAGVTRALVPVQVVGEHVLVPARVNGREVKLLLGDATWPPVLAPQVAQQSGLELTEATPRQRLVDGSRIPVLTVGSIEIGPFRLEQVEMMVHGDLQGVEGVLGAAIHRFFEVSVDRAGERLILEVRRPAP